LEKNVKKRILEQWL